MQSKHHFKIVDIEILNENCKRKRKKENMSTQGSREGEEWGTPPEMEENAAKIIQDLLPQKSKQRYNLTYDKFVEWQTSRNVKSMSEAVMLTYFEELAQNWQASTLWSHFSMLKSTISLKHNLDIGKYNRLMALLKRKSDGFASKKSKTLSSDDVERFLTEAPDVEYLATKVCTMKCIINKLYINF